MKTILSIIAILTGYIGFWLCKILWVSFHTPAFELLSYASLGISIGTWLWVLYCMWQAMAVVHPKPRTTSEFAVLGMLLPLFNLYWIFYVFVGFAKDYNLHLSQNFKSAERLSENLFLGFCVLSVLSVVPYVGVVFTALSLIGFCVLIPQIWRAIENLKTAPNQIQNTNI